MSGATFSKRRWALSILNHPDKPTGAVAMAFKLYMEMGADGTGAVVSDRDFACACSVSERACQNFKRWLLDSGFVVIQLKGNKGRPNTFRAIIPDEELAAPHAVNQSTSSARHAVNANRLAAPIAGNNQLDRHPLPEIEIASPAARADDAGSAAPHAVNPPPRALAHARLETPSGLVIINNNQSHTPTHVEQEAARVGEEAVGHGVFVNCETVRHRDFTISIAGIAMQLATAPIDMTPDQRSEAARTSAIAHAVQWAAEIEGGKRARDVVPSHVANFIRGAIVGQFNKSARGGRAPVGRPGEGEAQRRMRIISQITGGQS